MKRKWIYLVESIFGGRGLPLVALRLFRKINFLYNISAVARNQAWGGGYAVKIASYEPIYIRAVITRGSRWNIRRREKYNQLWCGSKITRRRPVRDNNFELIYRRRYTSLFNENYSQADWPRSPMIRKKKAKMTAESRLIYGPPMQISPRIAGVDTWGRRWEQLPAPERNMEIWKCLKNGEVLLEFPTSLLESGNISRRGDGPSSVISCRPGKVKIDQKCRLGAKMF